MLTIFMKEREVNSIRLTEVFNIGNGVSKQYSLRSVYINPSHVICLREDAVLKNRLNEGTLIEGLDDRQEFTRVTVDKSNLHADIVVIGHIDEIYKKLYIETRNVLRG